MTRYHVLDRRDGNAKLGDFGSKAAAQAQAAKLAGDKPGEIMRYAIVEVQAPDPQR